MVEECGGLDGEEGMDTGEEREEGVFRGGDTHFDECVYHHSEERRGGGEECPDCRE